MPELNSSAEITLNDFPGVGFNNPVILRNSVDCPLSICTPITLLNVETVIFEVTGWTDYQIGEDPTLLCSDSDGGQEFYETGIVCKNGDCLKDACSSRMHLTEYYCDGNYVRRIANSCEYGCSDGACAPLLISLVF